MAGIITRFAPAPTGFLHLGHVVNALYVWGAARQRSGRVLLRIEDHDRRRSRPEFERAILDDLEWLGFVADAPPVRQSERGLVYQHALEALARQGRVYGCVCSRAEIVRAGGAGRAGGDRGDRGARRLQPSVRPSDADELRYPGTCRDRGIVDGPNVGLRVRLDETVETFVDLRHGPQEQRPAAQCGDLLARDRDGFWTYQLVATVDDYLQGVTLVVRGDDLLASTGRQIQLARLLGRTTPAQFLHHGLIMKSPTQKLSKADGDTGVADLRARGWSAEKVIGHAAALARLIEEERDVRADEASAIITERVRGARRL